MLITASSMYRRRPNMAAIPLKTIISTLFADGQKGFVHSDQPIVDGQEALYKNTDGTGLVAAQGDLVGRIVDLTPNGFDAIARTDSARASFPGLRYDGNFSAYNVDQDGMLVNSAGVLVGVNFSVDAITTSNKYVMGATTERLDNGVGSTAYSLFFQQKI